MGRISFASLALAGLMATAGCGDAGDTSSEAVNDAATNGAVAAAGNDSAAANSAGGIQLNLDATPSQSSAAAEPVGVDPGPVVTD